MNKNKLSLNDWYNGLPANQQKAKRETIMFLLGIGNTMFYKALNGDRNFNPAEQQALNILAEQELDYGNGIDVTSTLNLVKA